MQIYDEYEFVCVCVCVCVFISIHPVALPVHYIEMRNGNSDEARLLILNLKRN